MAERGPMANERNLDAWGLAMEKLSDLELQLIMVGAKNGSLRAVGEPCNAFGAGLKAAMELNYRKEKGNGCHSC